MKLAYKRYLKAMTSFALSMTILVGGISHEAVAVEPYKDLEMSPIYFTDVSLCGMWDKATEKKCNTGDWKSVQLPITLWAFSVKNKGKSAYLNPRVEITLQNETGADLYSNILVITKRIEPGEIVWVAPEATWKNDTFITHSDPQLELQGVTKGFAKVISAKKSQPDKYRIKGFASGIIGSISDSNYYDYVGGNNEYYHASAVKGVFKNWARSVNVTIPVAVDARKVPSQWITVLYKESDGKILGGFKFANSYETWLGSIQTPKPPYTRTLVQDYDFLKRIVFVEAYVSRR